MVECAPGIKLCVTATQRGEMYVQQFGTDLFQQYSCDDYGLCKSGKPGSFEEKGPEGSMSTIDCCSGELCNFDPVPPMASPSKTTGLPAWSSPSQQAQEQQERLDFQVPATQLGELLLTFLDARYERKNRYGR